MELCFFSFSGGEIFLVFIAVLLLFGANKIPELAKMLGKGMNEFKRATDDLKREFNDGARGVLDDLKEERKFVDKEIRNLTTDEADREPDSNVPNDLGGVAREDEIMDREVTSTKKKSQTDSNTNIENID